VSVLEQTAVELRRAAGEARARWSATAWLSLAALAVAAVLPFLPIPGLHVDAHGELGGHAGSLPRV